MSYYEQILQDILLWCVRYTDILTAEDNSWKRKNFAKFVSQKGQNLILEECCKKVGIEVDFKSHSKPVWTNGEMVEDILKWCCKYTNLISAKTESGEGLIHFASMKGYPIIVASLIKNGVVVESKGKQNQTPLNLALEYENLEVAKILIQNGANVNSYHLMETPLHRAARLGKVEVAKFLLKKGAVQSLNSLITKTPLYMACEEGHLEVAKLLIQCGANVNKPWNPTPLYIACKKDHFDLVKLLLDSGARTDFRDKDLYTPLHIVSKSGNFELAKLLIRGGADVIINHQYGGSSTPLHIASFFGNIEIVKILLDHGCKHLNR